MDVITRPDTPPPSPATVPPRDPARRLWQAPLFVLGLSAFLLVWFLRGNISNGPYRLCLHQLKMAREALEQGNGNAENIAQDLQHLLDRGLLPSKREGEAHFLYGTALIRVAEHATTALAQEHWSKARQELEKAAELGVGDDDQTKLEYRLAKVSFYTPGDPAEVVERLAAAIKADDDPADRAEGYTLLTQANLRLTPPNVQGALEANEQFRKLPFLRDDVLLPARLTGAELLLRLKRPKEALEALSKVGNQAPSAILTQTHILRARSYQDPSYQDENKWAKAATAWQAAQTDTNNSPAQAGLIRYNLGLCYRRLDEPQSAMLCWEECVHNKNGDESAAAALELAELQLSDSKNDKIVLDRLEDVLRTVRKPDDWNNKLLDRTRACEIFEHCCQTARQAGRFDMAMQLVALYERLAAPGRAQVMRGEIAAEWGEARQKAARNALPAARPAEEQAARDLFKRAGEDYEKAAKQAANLPAHGDYLWQAAKRYIQAGEQVKAQTMLEQMFELTPRPDAHLAEGWFLLGESYRKEKETQSNPVERDAKMRAAESAYKACIQYSPTIFAYRARFQIAQFARERGEIDFAVSALEQMLTDIRGLESDPALKEVKEQACFNLVDICYARKDYMRVVQRLEVMLDKLPATMEASRARFELANSYRLLADEQEQGLNDGTMHKLPEARANFKQVCDRWRTLAVEQYETLIATVEKPESSAHLDPKARRDVYYFAARTLFDLGKYDAALAAYDRMTHRYIGQPDYWTAIAGMVSSYTGLGKEDEVRHGLETIRNGLDQMDLETRRAMEQYLHEVETALKQHQGR